MGLDLKGNEIGKDIEMELGWWQMDKKNERVGKPIGKAEECSF